VGTGYLIEEFGWNAGFYFWIFGAILAAIMMVIIWVFKEKKLSMSKQLHLEGSSSLLSFVQDREGEAKGVPRWFNENVYGAEWNLIRKAIRKIGLIVIIVLRRSGKSFVG